jgi:hypothetical protein
MRFFRVAGAKYPIGLVVRIRMISGQELEGQVVKIKATALGEFLHVEYDDGVINVTSKQIIGFYDFCPLRGDQRVRIG